MNTAIKISHEYLVQKNIPLSITIIDPDTKIPTIAYLKPMELAAATIKLILQTGLDHPSTITLMGLFKKAGKLKNNMHALVYILDNVCLQFTEDYPLHLSTLISFMAEEKENPSEIFKWDDLYDTLVNDFKDACVVALELEMMDFLMNPATKNSYEKLHREYIRLHDAFECVFGPFDLKASLYVYISKRLVQLEQENKYQIVRPFNSTLVKMIIGKNANPVYASPDDDADRIESIKAFRSMRDLVFLITNTTTFENHIEEFMKDINKHLSLDTKTSLVRVANIKSILLHLETYGYDLRYSIRLMNRMKRAGFLKGKGYNIEAGEIVKNWLTRIFFQYLQKISSDHIDHGITQIEYYITKYEEIWGVSLPFQEVGKQLSKFQDILKYQHKRAVEICSDVSKYAAFGGMLNTASAGIAQQARNKKLRKEAAEHFSVYSAYYIYTWNIEPFQSCYDQLHAVTKSGDLNNHYNDYLKDLSKGKSTIDHEMKKKDLWYQIKLNSQLAMMIQRVMPNGMKLLDNDPNLTIFEFKANILSK